MVRDAAEALAAAIESIDGLRVRGQGINQVVVEAVDAAGESDPAHQRRSGCRGGRWTLLSERHGVAGPTGDPVVGLELAH